MPRTHTPYSADFKQQIEVPYGNYGTPRIHVEPCEAGICVGF